VKIAVVGAGQWGMALAQTLSMNPGTRIALWARSPALAGSLIATRRNATHLPDIVLSEDVAVSDELAFVLQGSDIAILAVPTHGMREIAERCRPLLDRCAVVSAAKGFERDSGLTMTAILAMVLGAEAPIAALSGPNIATEIARGLPAAAVVASADDRIACFVRDGCTGAQLRMYSSNDVIGVEYGGALKNVIAIAAGIGDGMHAGDNGKAAIMTRGLAEMARLGGAAGANPLTFAGLTGVGDCFVTCMSPYSRNRRLGERIGEGATVAEAAATTVMVTEGVNAAAAAQQLAQRANIEMPLVDQVCAILFEGKPVRTALADLMRRGARAELAELGLSPGGEHPAGLGPPAGAC